MKVRSLFISDVHLGLDHTNVDDLLKLLKIYEFENLYLVGDIIDGWRLKRQFNWNDSCNKFLRKILKLSKQNKKIIYIIGNHDGFLYKFEDQSFGNIHIKEHEIYTTLNGEKITIIHGHQFDGIVKCNKWLQKIGSILYGFLLSFNVNFNIIRRKLGYNYWSISKWLKTKTKEALKYINDYEDTLIDYCNNNLSIWWFYWNDCYRQKTK